MKKPWVFDHFPYCLPSFKSVLNRGSIGMYLKFKILRLFSSLYWFIKAIPWCGINRSSVICPYIFSNVISSSCYSQVLSNTLLETTVCFFFHLHEIFSTYRRFPTFQLYPVNPTPENSFQALLSPGSFLATKAWLGVLFLCHHNTTFKSHLFMKVWYAHGER